MKKLMPWTAGWLAFSVCIAAAWADEEPVTDETAQAGDEELAQAGEAASEADDFATEETAAVELAEDEADEEQEATTLIAPFSASLSITDTFDLGTISRDQFTTTDYNLLIFGFGLGYQTPVEGLSTSLGWSVSKFTTASGGSTFQREGRVGDISLGASWAFWQDERVTGLAFSSSLGLSLPTSEASRFTNLRTAASLGLGISRSFGNLSLRYGFGVSKNFHRDTSVVADLKDFELEVLARDGGRENIGEAQIALDTGVLSEWGIRNSLSMSYGWFPGFSTAISFSFSDHWTYDNGTITSEDEFTSPNAVVGRGHGQSMTGSISASYAFLDYFSASLSMSTSQQPKTADNQSVRFPFFDLETGNLSNTSIALTLSASY